MTAAITLLGLLSLASLPALDRPQPGQIVKPAPKPPAPPPTAASPRTGGAAVIKGQLVDALTGNPIRGGRVSANGPAIDPPMFGVATNGEGAFELRDLPAGRYRLDATKSGYLTLVQSNGGKPLPPLTVGEQETVDKVVLRLSRGGIIAGTVVDELGEPLMGSDVSAMRYRYTDGRRVLSGVPTSVRGSSVTTDDRGGFRLYGLEPGDYYVSVRPRAENLSGGSAPAGPVLSYYPGTANMAEAARVTVRAGRETQGISFAAAVARMARIRGRAVTSSGEPMAGGGLGLFRRTFDGGMRSDSAPIRADGSFEIGNLPPATYLLMTLSQNARVGDPGESARLVVSLNGEDLDDVLLVAAPTGAARGRVVTDEGTPPPFAQGTVNIHASPVDPNLPYMMRPQARVLDDWTFELTGLFDRMHIRSYPITGPASASGWTLKAVTLDGEDVTDSGIEFRSGRTVEDIEIVFTRKTSQLAGRVATDQDVAPGTWVVVFPSDESRWVPQSRWIRATAVGPKGQFRLSPIPSDDYLIVAATGLEEGQWMDPEFLKAVKDRAERLSIAEGETTVQDVKMVEWRK